MILTNMETSLLIALIFAGAELLVILFQCYSQIKHFRNDALKAKLKSFQKELLTVYKDIEKLLCIEENLTKQINSNKQSVRQGNRLSEKSQPQRVRNRISELENILNIS